MASITLFLFTVSVVCKYDTSY